MSSGVSPKCLDSIVGEKKSHHVHLPYEIIIDILHTYLTTTEFLQYIYLNSIVSKYIWCKRIQSAGQLAILLREDWVRCFLNNETRTQLIEKKKAKDLMDDEAAREWICEAKDLMEETLFGCNSRFSVYENQQYVARVKSSIAFGYTPHVVLRLAFPPKCDIKGARYMQKTIHTYTLDDAKTFLKWLSEVKIQKTKIRFIHSYNRQLIMSLEQMRLLRNSPYALALLDK